MRQLQDRNDKLATTKGGRREARDMADGEEYADGSHEQNERDERLIKSGAITQLTDFHESAARWWVRQRTTPLTPMLDEHPHYHHGPFRASRLVKMVKRTWLALVSI